MFKGVFKERATKCEKRNQFLVLLSFNHLCLCMRYIGLQPPVMSEQPNHRLQLTLPQRRTSRIDIQMFVTVSVSFGVLFTQAQ